MRGGQQYTRNGHTKAPVDECRLACHQPAEYKPDASGYQGDSCITPRFSSFLGRIVPPIEPRLHHTSPPTCAGEDLPMAEIMNYDPNLTCSGNLASQVVRLTFAYGSTAHRWR